MRLLITGASGLLGLNLSLLAHRLGHYVIGLVNSNPLCDAPFEVRKIDLLDTEKALHVIEDLQPEAIIHCAAVANLRVAEEAPERTQRMNVDVPGKISKAAYRWGIPFLHISTDAVFDGERGNYVETDPPHPLSVYAQSKLAAERLVQETNPNALVARVVFYGWSLLGNRSLSEFFYNHLKDGMPVKGFTDTFFCPLYVEDLGEVLLEMLDKDLNGLYHVVSPENLSKYEFGMKIAQKFGFDPALIEPVKMREMKRSAPRSLNLVLKADKVQKDLGHQLPLVDSGIDRFHRRWQEDYHLKLQDYSCH
jgi:dTDP-4-dehydrorhamnose reductase